MGSTFVAVTAAFAMMVSPSVASAMKFQSDRVVVTTKTRSDGTFAVDRDGPFAFTLVPPGDYVLAFGNGKPHPLDPNHPFPDTFYPSAPDRASATVIHLAAGQHIVNADIHLPPGRETRQLEVVLNWNGLPPADTFGAVVHVARTEGMPPFARKMADDTYIANLFPDEVYRVNASAACKQACRSAVTDTVVVNGADVSTARVTLSFAADGCQLK